MSVAPESLLVVACFSRHADALDWARARLEEHWGPVALASPVYDFQHTRYYEATMGPQLRKQLLTFAASAPADCLPDVKRRTIALERELAESRRFPEIRPLNLDPGLVQLGKFLLATTKDQAHRVYLRDGIFAEVTLRYTAGAFEPWEWTYADYREPAVRAYLGEARALLHERIRARTADKSSG